ncbi:MAG: NAD(P)-dependent alcohol dehydrogenase [Myxococcota bacterium]
MGHTMQAATIDRFGTPDVLEVNEVPRPTPGSRQVLVEVHASAVTQGDRRLRAADFPGVFGLLGRLMFGIRRPRFPVGGSTFAGRVVAVGTDVTRFAVGDDVYGNLVTGGGYGEYLIAGEGEAVARMPKGLRYADAAALPYGAVTALAFLRERLKVQAGERVLIVGATGGVGRPAVQIAKHLGAHVTAVGHRGLAELEGADARIDYREEDFLQRDERWDAILDCTEGDHFRSYGPILSAKGRSISVYVTLRGLFEMALNPLRRGPKALVGIATGSPEELEDITALVEAGALREPVAARFPLARVADAHWALEGEGLAGSIVVDVRERVMASARVAVA